MINYKKQIDNYLAEEISTIKSLDFNIISRIINEIEIARKSGSTIYICGNGGSASTASHFCCDFNKGYSGKLKKNTNFICLSDNISTLTAIANDLSYDEIFSYQLSNRMKKKDILFVISGSGKSKNIIKAMEIAKSKKCKIIGLCGYSGGKVKEMSNICLHVNTNNMQIVEDIHTILNHCMVYILSNTK